MIDIRDREFSTLQDLRTIRDEIDSSTRVSVMVTPEQVAKVWLLLRDQTEHAWSGHPATLFGMTLYSLPLEAAEQHLNPAPSPTGL